MIFTDSEKTLLVEQDLDFQDPKEGRWRKVEGLRLSEASDPSNPIRSLDGSAIVIQCVDLNKEQFYGRHTLYYLYISTQIQYQLAIELIKHLFGGQLTEHDLAQVMMDLSNNDKN